MIAMHPITTYFITEYPINKPVVTQLPFLFLDGELCVEQVAFVRRLIRSNHSQSMIRRATIAIGLFWEFLAKTNAQVKPETLPHLFEEFIEARGFGSKELGWKPVEFRTATIDAEHISKFFDFCAATIQTPTLNPKEAYTPSWGQRMGEMRNRCKSDLLYHLHDKATPKRRRFQFKDSESTGQRNQCYPSVEQVKTMIN